MITELSSFQPWTFDRRALVEIGVQRAAAYRDARPFPHVVIDHLLGDARCDAIARAVPSPTHPGWKRRDYAEQAARLGQLQRTGFEGVGAELRWLLAELSSMAFLDFLGALTGKRGLIADPHFTGAGPIVTLRGGHLALHTDFNRDSTRHLDRAVTALYYAPVVWDEAWGGELELWDRERTKCEARIAPVRDRLVIMDYDEDYWHGHPNPVSCPDDNARVVIAAYYYVARADGDAHGHGAIWA
jgi:hypothetical protein